MSKRITLFIINILCTNLLANSQTTINIGHNKGDIVKKKITINNYSISKKVYPDLQFCATYPTEIPLNAFLKPTSNQDSLELVLYICNMGKAKAIDLIDSSFLITKVNNEFVLLDEISTNTFTSGMSIFPDNARGLKFPVVKVGIGKVAKAFFCFKLYYKDITGKRRLLKDIIDVTSSGLVPNISLNGPNSNDYKSIIEFLRLKKLW